MRSVLEHDIQLSVELRFIVDDRVNSARDVTIESEEPGHCQSKLYALVYAAYSKQ